MEALNDEVVTTIRGVLVSTKGSLEVRRLQKDYRMIIGEDIPYRKLGFKTLEDYLNNVPTLKVRKLPNGETLIDAVTTTESKHISQLVDKQKTSKKKFGFPSNKYKAVPSKFSASKFKKSLGNGNPKFSGKPFNSKGNFRRHSDFNPNYKTFPEKRRSVFERLGPKVVSDECDSYDECHEEEEEPELKLSISDRLKKYRSSKETIDSDQEDAEDESPTRPFRNPYPLEVNTDESPIASTSTKPESPNRLKDILNKISDIKLNSVENKPPSPSLEKENQISGPTNRMNDILNKVSELKSKENAIQKLEENFPTEEINPRRFSMPVFGMQAPVFQAPDIDRPRMRIKPGFSNLPNAPVMPPPNSKPSNFQFRPPFPSNNPIRSSVQSRLQQNRNISIPAIPLNSQDRKQEELRRPFENPISPTILEETINKKDFSSYYRNDIPRFQNKIKTPEEKLSPQNTTSALSPDKPEEQGRPIPVITGNRSNKEEYCDKILVTSPEDTRELLTMGTIVQVTCVVSPVKIWCQLLQTSSAESFDQLMYLLGVEYTNGGHFTSQFFVGGYFVAHLDGCWYRVQVLNVLENDCQCFLIDHGEEVIIPQNDIRKLLKQFAHIPAQAVLCSLAGLGELVSYTNSLAKLKGLVEHRYYAVKNKACSGYSIDLYDITPAGEKDVLLNQLLLKQIIGDSVVTVLKDKGVYKGYITHVETNGFIYIRVESEGLQKFFHLLTSLSENEVALRSVQQPVENEIYLQKNMQSQRFERCKLIDQDPNRRYAQFLFIDSGRVVISCLKDITLYFIDSQIIYSYPPLAVKVKLDLDEIPEQFPDRIQYLTEIYSQNTVRTIRFLRFEQNEENTPICDIFMQAEFGKSLISLKAVLLTSLKNNEENPRGEEIESLPSHIPPEIDSYLDAKVVFSISPSHFYVQLYNYAQKFKDLMKKLQDRYNELASTEGNSQNIQIGKIYAYMYTDHIWYRVQVIKIDPNRVVHIFFSDFGYEMDVPIDSLYHLEPQFYALPHQAVKMKIFGIKPKFGEWSEEDCDYFTSLVTSKAFVCLVKKVENSVYLEITAEIFDTSQAEDVNIGQFLVDVTFAGAAR